MTIVEKAAYLKGLMDGMKLDLSSDSGKLWAAASDLLSEMAKEIEDLQGTSLDFADTIDEFADELAYLESISESGCEPDDDDKEDPFDCEFSGGCDECPGKAECGASFLEDDDDFDDDDILYDGIVYDVTCPKCGEELSFDEETLQEGFIDCPACGEHLEFDLDEE